MACARPDCGRQSRLFLFGIPLAVFVVCVAVGLVVGAEAISASQQATARAFADASLASGTVLQSSLAVTMSHLETAARSLEVRPPRATLCWAQCPSADLTALLF